MRALVGRYRAVVDARERGDAMKVGGAWHAAHDVRRALVEQPHECPREPGIAERCEHHAVECVPCALAELVELRCPRWRELE